MVPHRRKKLEVIVEAPILRQAEDILEAAGVHVFTVVEAREGRGLSGRWNDSNVADALDQRMIIAVATPEAVEAAADGLARLFARYPGVMFTSDVDVFRPERF